MPSGDFQEALKCAYSLERTAGMLLELTARRCGRHPLLHVTLLNHLQTTDQQARLLRHLLETQVQVSAGANDFEPRFEPESWVADGILLLLALGQLKSSNYQLLADLAETECEERIAAQFSECAQGELAVMQRLHGVLQKISTLQD